MRLIDADELLDFLQMLPIDLGRREVEDIRAHIREMPKIESEQQWIPCSERLPETDEMMLVTAQPKKGAPNVNRAYYMDGAWHGSGSMSNVIAWMPLPDPFEPEA